MEIGPGQSLGALMRAAGCPPERWSTIVSTLPAAGDGRADDAVLTDCLARLWLVGADLDWPTLYDRQPGARPEDPATVPNRVPLPTYAFQRQEHWIDTPMRPALYTGGTAGGGSGETTLETVADLPKLPEEQWLHLPVWRQTAAPAAVDLPESWLVFSRDGVADRVVERLRGSGAAVTVVRPGEACAEGDYAIRPGNLDDTRQLLRDLRVAGGVPSRVVHLWALGSCDPVVDGLHTLVALARAAGEVGVEDWALDVVTAGAQQVLPGDATDPLAATLTGPALVIPVEYPSVTARLIDLDAQPTPKTVAALTAELARPAADRIVALRHGRRWVCGFETMPEEALPSAAPALAAGSASAPVLADQASGILRESGVYLITGGLGGIALGMAERLAAECHAKLVLFGRTGLPPREQWSAIVSGGQRTDEPTRERVRKVQALLDLGADVEIVVGDLGHPEDVRRAVTTAIDRFGALHGVLHAAGLPGMGLMQFKEPGELDTVLAPKVAGTLALAEALHFGEPDEIPLDFLVLFSSITSATGGGPGQVDYCSANAFLDAFAAQQSAAGLPVVSVDWGEWLWNAWSAGLDGYAEGLRSFLEENRTRIGIGFDEGWRCLLRALACGEPRVVVSTQDFGSLVRLSAEFTLDAVAATAALDGGALHPRPELMTPFQEPEGATEETIARMWRESLRLDERRRLDNFFELGGNSLLGVTIVTALRKEFGLDDLPPHTLYEAPTVAALAEVVDKARSGAPIPMPGRRRRRPGPAAPFRRPHRGRPQALAAEPAWFCQTDKKSERDVSCAESPGGSATSVTCPPSAPTVDAMTETMICRGPDEGGVFIDGPVALGHRRLAVIDIEGGKQPMTAEGLAPVAHHLQRRGLQLPGAARRAGGQGPHASAPPATPRSCCTPTWSGAAPSSTASPACTPSRSGTAAPASCCWSATAWASSRCTTRRRPTASCSAPSPRPSWPPVWSTRPSTWTACARSSPR